MAFGGPYEIEKKERLHQSKNENPGILHPNPGRGGVPNVELILEMVDKKLKSGRGLNPSLAKIVLELNPEDYSVELGLRIKNYQGVVAPKTWMDAMVMEGVSGGEYLQKEDLERFIEDVKKVKEGNFHGYRK